MKFFSPTPSKTPCNAVNTPFNDKLLYSPLSLFPGQDHLLTLAPALVKLFLGVLPLVLFTPLDGLQLLALDLSSLLDHLGYVSVTLDALDFGPGT